jgi:pimeloyl-ACP methyl ester carboxylesterase
MDAEIVLEDVTLRVTDVGEGPPIVLLHAGGESRRVWQPVSAALIAGGFRTVAVDQRGHGESTGSRSDGLRSFARDVSELATRFQSPPVLVGASLGGMAILLAMAERRLVQKARAVVLVDVVPAPDADRARRYLQGSSNVRTGDMSQSPVATDILAHAEDLERAATSLTVPTLLIQGTASPVTLDSDVLRFRKLVPHASVRRVAGAGHLIAREAPQALGNVLLDFLRELEGAREAATLPELGREPPA